MGSSSLDFDQAGPLRVRLLNHGMTIMSRPQKKRRTSRRAGVKTARGLPGGPRAGLPAKDSVRAVVDFVSPQNVSYKILKTSETDAYDQIPEGKKKRRPK